MKMNELLESVNGLFPLITDFQPPSEQIEPTTPIAIVELFVEDLEKENRKILKLTDG